MSIILGIDLGTSSVKGMLFDTNKGVLSVEATDYKVSIPNVSYAEQSPNMWWSSTLEVLSKLRKKNTELMKQIKAVGFSGQMHGLVATDSNGEPVRPAILWLDQRTESEIQNINSKLPIEEMGEVFANKVSTGFAFPSLLWIKEMEPDIFNKIEYIMLPKDFIRMKMTGEFGVEISDASSTTMFHTKKRDWAWDVIEEFELPKRIFPKCSLSTDIAGYITDECFESTGIPVGTPVIYGAGDQLAQSIGNGCIEEGKIISNIGTGGQISTFINEFKYDKKLRTHTFCHALFPAYTIFGATLCSGMSLNWLKNKLLHVESYQELSEMAMEVEAGSNGLIYLPYLSGERTPHMNSSASGMFFGVKLIHDRRHFARAVMEGVAFSLKDSLTIFNELGIRADTIIASGGGASSEVWLQIQADIFNKPVTVCHVKEQACLGACLLAAFSIGEFKSMKEACDSHIEFSDKIYYPDKKNAKVYEKSYEVFKQLYFQTENLMSY